MKNTDELTALRSQVEELRKALRSCKGYLLNAKIDLQTNCSKQTTINTIDGGLKMVDSALSNTGGEDYRIHGERHEG